GAGAAGLGSGAGAAGAGAGPGAGTGDGAAAPWPSPGCAAACPSPSSTTSTLPSDTLSPTLTRSSTTRPAADDGISIDAFSLSTVTRLCSRPTSSPSDTSTSMTSTSSKSPMSGTRTSIALIVLVSGSCVGGIGLVGVDPVLLDDRGDRFGRQRPLVDELAHRRQHDEVAIDLEMTSQAPAEVRPAEAVGAQHPVGAPLGNERADLVGEELGVVRGGDDGARGVREQPRHVGHPRLVTGMQQVVALAGQAVPAQLREAGRAPDVGRNAPVALEEIGRRDHFAQDRARTEQLRARTLPALASGRLVLADVAAQPIHPPDDAFLVAHDQPRLGVVLVHHGDVEVDVLLPADHALEAVVEDHRQLVSEGRVVGDAVGYL